MHLPRGVLPLSVLIQVASGTTLHDQAATRQKIVPANSHALACGTKRRAVVQRICPIAKKSGPTIRKIHYGVNEGMPPSCRAHVAVATWMPRCRKATPRD